MEHYAILYVLIGLRRLLLMLLLNPRTLQDDCLAGGGAVASTPVLRLAVEQLKQLLAILEDDVPTIRLGTSQQDDVIVAAAASSRCCGRNSCCCWLANFNPGRIVLRFLDQSIHCSLVEDERTIRVADDLICESRGGRREGLNYFSEIYLLVKNTNCGYFTTISRREIGKEIKFQDGGFPLEFRLAGVFYSFCYSFIRNTFFGQ